jgi:hypothetical protein
MASHIRRPAIPASLRETILSLLVMAENGN